jgi:hypothetical protein
MSDFNVRSDAVDVEQIMERIRARVAEKRGVDYTEEQIREMATVKLEKFLDPKGVRSDLLEQFRRTQAKESPALPHYEFDDDSMLKSSRPLLQAIRRMLGPVVKLFVNLNPLIQALHIQSQLNRIHADREARRRETDHLQFEVLHNLVVETTRLGIEVKNLTMRLESLSSRLDFNERRARALERVVVYKPAAEEPPIGRGLPPPAAARAETPAGAAEAGPGGPAQAGPEPAEGPGQRSRRRRRRRGRRGGAPASALLGGAPGGHTPQPARAASMLTAAPGADSALAADTLEGHEPPESEMTHGGGAPSSGPDERDREPFGADVPGGDTEADDDR